MSENETKTFKTDRELLEQVVTKLEVMDTRLQFVEGKVRERGFDTKPIWQQALAEILEVKHELEKVNRKLQVFSDDIMNARAELRDHEDRLRRIEIENEGGKMETIQ